MKTKIKPLIRPFDAANYLQTEEDIAMYLDTVLTDQEEIERLKQKLAIAQTARMAYAKALEKELPGAEKVAVQ